MTTTNIADRPTRAPSSASRTSGAWPTSRATSSASTGGSTSADQIGEPAIRVRGLQKSYKKLEVLRGVDFDVAPGRIFALLGSNGAGKTTVVRILSTLLKVDAGAASV
ncbi:MAG: ATP-binding cassette domain-containing protein, partial [Solirubrobacteraceae bacterium]